MSRPVGTWDGSSAGPEPLHSPAQHQASPCTQPRPAPGRGPGVWEVRLSGLCQTECRLGQGDRPPGPVRERASLHTHLAACPATFHRGGLSVQKRMGVRGGVKCSPLLALPNRPTRLRSTLHHDSSPSLCPRPRGDTAKPSSTPAPCPGCEPGMVSSPTPSPGDRGSPGPGSRAARAGLGREEPASVGHALLSSHQAEPALPEDRSPLSCCSAQFPSWAAHKSASVPPGGLSGWWSL